MVYMYHVNLCRLQGIHIVDLMSTRARDAGSDICTHWKLLVDKVFSKQCRFGMSCKGHLTVLGNLIDLVMN